MANQPDTLEEIVKQVNQGGDWQLYAQQLMDDVRRNPAGLAEIAGTKKPAFKDDRLVALFQSLIHFYARKYGQPIPHWVFPPVTLDQPWFPSGMEKLKATAILESPLEFRRNNIFVLKNFTERF